MKLSVSHRISTRFDPERRRFVQSHRIHPTACASQKLLDWDVSVSHGTIGATFTDGAGDRTATISTPGHVSELVLEITGLVETFDTLGVLRDVREKVPPQAYMTQTRLVRTDSAVTELASNAVSGIADGSGLDRAHALASAVTAELTPKRSASVELVPAADVMEAGEGGAADFAHVLITAAHAASMPARFVWGYMLNGSADLALAHDEENPGPAIPVWPGHAWAELWVDGLGWVGFDAYGECCPDDRFIRLCSGRDGADAAPLRGVAMGAGASQVEVALDVAASDQ